MRMDSGFFSAKTIKTCRRHQLHYSITVRQTKPIRQAIATLDEDDWTDIVYPDSGLAQVADTRYKGDRVIVRRTRLVGAQGAVPELALPRSPKDSAPTLCRNRVPRPGTPRNHRRALKARQTAKLSPEQNSDRWIRQWSLGCRCNGSRACASCSSDPSPHTTRSAAQCPENRYWLAGLGLVLTDPNV
jgi:hypothetical protein